MLAKHMAPARIWLGAVLLALLGKAHGALPASAPPDGRRTVVVLDPVNLTKQENPNSYKSDSAWGEFLRGCFASRPAWKVISRDSMRAKEKDFGFSAYRGCHEFQCAFDAGNVFSAEFVLFSSLTRLGGAYVYTLNLVHVPGSQTVWSRVGETGLGEAGAPDVPLENAWTHLIGRLAPETAPLARGGKLGQITVLDLSLKRWAPAQAVAERVATHLYATRAFDLMGSKEQNELVGALGIDKSAFIPTDSALLELGGKMGVSHLVSSRLIEERGHAYRLELGFYDIAGRRKVKAARSGSAQDLVDVLRFETAFISSLFPIEADGEEALPAPHRSRTSWAGAAVGVVGVAAGGACGIVAYRSYQASQRKTGQIEDARSRESALSLQGEAATLKRRSLYSGAAGLAGLLAGGAFLIFSF
jgi:hypothetical protein